MDFKKLNDIDALNAKSLQLRYSNTSQALLFAEEALKYSTEINDEKWLAISKLNKLWCLFLQSDFNDIIDELIKPTFYFSDSGLESYRAEALLLTAQVQEGYGDYENSAINAYKALELFQNNSVEWGKIQTLSLIGSIQARLGEYKNSINTFTNCLEQRTKINDLPALASTHNQIARSYLLNNDFENAEKHYKESIRIRRELNLGAALSWSYLGIANMYEKICDYIKAESCYNISLECNNGNIDKRCRQQCLLGNGRVKTAINQLNEATELLVNALNIANEIKANQLIFETYFCLSEVEKRKENYLKSLEYFKEYHRIKEIVFNTAQENKFNFIKKIHETEKAIQEAEIYRIKNVELHNAYLLVEEKNKEITDSINYAKRIQQAKLPKIEEVNSFLPECFILFKPKAIVSGDFYFFHKNGELVIIAAADCTGHGVPGALMSMIGMERLENAVFQTNETSEILKQLNIGIKTSLKQSDSEESTRDGMDISLVCLDNHILKNQKDKVAMHYAGANRPLWIIRKGEKEIEEIKATKKAIGGLTDDDQHFDTHNLKLLKGDTFYIFSDGYADQFNADNKKLMTRTFKEILLSIQDKSMEEQKEFLNTYIENWKAGTDPKGVMRNVEQTDDVLVIGIRV